MFTQAHRVIPRRFCFETPKCGQIHPLAPKRLRTVAIECTTLVALYLEKVLRNPLNPVDAQWLGFSEVHTYVLRYVRFSLPF